MSDLLQHASDEATQGMSPIPMTQLQHPGTVLAYMDDCTMAVPSCLANRVAADLSDIFAASGFILNVQNCRFIGPKAAHIEDPVFACNPEGDVVLGSPTGTIDSTRESTISRRQATIELFGIKQACFYNPSSQGRLRALSLSLTN